MSGRKGYKLIVTFHGIRLLRSRLNPCPILFKSHCWAQVSSWNERGLFGVHHASQAQDGSITLTEILPVPITLLEPYEATISRTFELREHDSRIWLSMLVRLFYIPSTIPTYFWFLLHVGCIFLDKI